MSDAEKPEQGSIAEAKRYKPDDASEAALIIELIDGALYNIGRCHDGDNARLVGAELALGKAAARITASRLSMPDRASERKQAIEALAKALDPGPFTVLPRGWYDEAYSCARETARRKAEGLINAMFYVAQAVR
jgi:hypothetical protein